MRDGDSDHFGQLLSGIESGLEATSILDGMVNDAVNKFVSGLMSRLSGCVTDEDTSNFLARENVDKLFSWLKDEWKPMKIDIYPEIASIVGDDNKGLVRTTMPVESRQDVTRRIYNFCHAVGEGRGTCGLIVGPADFALSRNSDSFLNTFCDGSRAYPRARSNMPEERRSDSDVITN